MTRDLRQYLILFAFVFPLFGLFFGFVLYDMLVDKFFIYIPKFSIAIRQIKQLFGFSLVFLLMPILTVLIFKLERQKIRLSLYKLIPFSMIFIVFIPIYLRIYYLNSLILPYLNGENKIEPDINVLTIKPNLYMIVGLLIWSGLLILTTELINSYNKRTHNNGYSK